MAGWRFQQAAPGHAWRARDSRRGVVLKDTFADAQLAYFKRETKRLRRDLRNPSVAKLPRITGKLQRNMSADVALVRGPFGEKTIAVEVRNRVTYTPYVKRLPPALDRFFQRKAYPRWQRTLQSGIDETFRGGVV